MVLTTVYNNKIITGHWGEEGLNIKISLVISPPSGSVSLMAVRIFAGEASGKNPPLPRMPKVTWLLWPWRLWQDKASSSWKHLFQDQSPDQEVPGLILPQWPDREAYDPQRKSSPMHLSPSCLWQVNLDPWQIRLPMPPYLFTVKETVITEKNTSFLYFRTLSNTTSQFSHAQT